jgi:hypothetical protein
MRNLEAHELVEDRDLVAEELQEFMRISDILSGRHVRGDLHTLVEGLESFFTMRAPELRETTLHCIGGVLIAITEPGLKVRDAKDALEGRVDPTRPILIAESEHHGVVDRREDVSIRFTLET